MIESPIDAGCPDDGVVLDPFFGSGTTAEVALTQDKNWVGIELNSEYIEIAEKRLKNPNIEYNTRIKGKKFWGYYLYDTFFMGRKLRTIVSRQIHWERSSQK